MNNKKIYVVVETQVTKNGDVYTYIRRSFTNIVLARQFLAQMFANFKSSGIYDVATHTENVSFRAVSDLTGTSYLIQLLETEVND
jgi:hypothetical protein